MHFSICDISCLIDHLCCHIFYPLQSIVECVHLDLMHLNNIFNFYSFLCHMLHFAKCCHNHILNHWVPKWILFCLRCLSRYHCRHWLQYVVCHWQSLICSVWCVLYQWHTLHFPNIFRQRVDRICNLSDWLAVCAVNYLVCWRLVHRIHIRLDVLCILLWLLDMVLHYIYWCCVVYRWGKLGMVEVLLRNVDREGGRWSWSGYWCRWGWQYFISRGFWLTHIPMVVQFAILSDLRLEHCNSLSHFLKTVRIGGRCHDVGVLLFRRLALR